MTANLILTMAGNCCPSTAPVPGSNKRRPNTQWIIPLRPLPLSHPQTVRDIETRPPYRRDGWHHKHAIPCLPQRAPDDGRHRIKHKYTLNISTQAKRSASSYPDRAIEKLLRTCSNRARTKLPVLDYRWLTSRARVYN